MRKEQKESRPNKADEFAAATIKYVPLRKNLSLIKDSATAHLVRPTHFFAPQKKCWIYPSSLLLPAFTSAGWDPLGEDCDFQQKLVETNSNEYSVLSCIPKHTK